MPDNTMILYLLAEIAGVLLLVCIFLIFHVGKLKKLIDKLEAKIVDLRKVFSKSRKESKQAQQQLAEKNSLQPKDFVDFLDEEIDKTRDYHQGLNPDRDIVLDIATDAPLDRQSASLRHACLIAEKEACYAGDEAGSSWDVLQSKFQQIIQFYISAAAPSEPVEEADVASNTAEDEMNNLKQQLENLEQFKKLFFEMEDKWETAKSQADDYYQQLLAMGNQLDAGEDFDELLKNYSAAFDPVGELMNTAGAAVGATPAPEDSTEIDNLQSSIGKTVIANQEEMQRLRNMAIDQHKMINELKKKLHQTDSEEDRQQVVDELTAQMEKQQRFLKEAETCTQLIEDELSRAMQENEELRLQVKAGAEPTAISDQDTQRLESLVSDLTSESKEMLTAIAALEDENASLKSQLEAADASGATDNNSELLKEKLGEMQQELLNLQTQHIELEERYLELKMK